MPWRLVSTEFVSYGRYKPRGGYPENAQPMYVDDTFLSKNQTQIRRKWVGSGVGGGRIVYQATRPVAFSTLQNIDLVDTTDLCLIFGCSARTVYRWVTDHSLRPYGKIGREFLFSKGEIVRWFDSSDRPASGRPPLRGR